MAGTEALLDHIAGQAAARKLLQQVHAGPVDPEALYELLAGLPRAQRRGCCRIVQKALERAAQDGRQ